MDLDLRLFLARPDKTEIGEIVDLESIDHNIQTSTSDELSVSIPYLVERDMENVENPLFHQIREKYLVRVQSERMSYDKWMVVSRINKSGDSNDKTKEITLYSKEYELSYQPIVEWAGAFLNGEYRKESLQVQQVVPSVLSNTVWTLGTVDAQIDDYRSFEFSGITKLEALYEIGRKFKSVIVWDTFNNKVNFVHEDNFKSDEGLSVSYEKYLDTINEEIEASDIVTRIIPRGYEDITINEYNPTGTNYVQNFNFFLYPFQQDEQGNVLQSSYWLSDDLCKNLIDYADLVEEKTSEYNTLVSERDTLIEDRLDKEGEIESKETELTNVQNEIDVNQTNDIDASDLLQQEDTLQGELDTLQSELETIENNINSKTDSIQDISSSLSMNNNFTQSQMDELSTIGKTEEWTNESINDREELYNEALSELEKRNKPQPVIKSDLVDLYHIEEAFKDLRKIKIGAKVQIEYEFFDINVEAQIMEISVDYLSGSISLVISSIEQLKDDEDRFIETVYSNASVAGQVLENRGRWDQITDVNNTVANFLNNKLDSAKQEIVSGVNNTVTVNHRGITLESSDDPLRFIRQTNGVIGFTADGGQTFSTVLDYTGVYADKLVGRIIAGQNLTIENTSATYLMNDEGFSITRSDGLVRSFLNGDDGIKIQNRNSTSSSWEDKFYADTNGNIIANDLTANNLTINGGTISWSNVDAPDYTDIQGSKPPSNADVTETEITSTSVYAPYLRTNSAYIQGTVTAGRIQTSDSGDLFAEITHDASGSKMFMYDDVGNLNMRIGTEGAGLGSNTGGTMILYDDSESQPRIEAGITNGNGRINLKDDLGNIRAFIEADTPSFSIANSSNTPVTYLTDTHGYINQERIATRNWVQNNADLTAKFG